MQKSEIRVVALAKNIGSMNEFLGFLTNHCLNFEPDLTRVEWNNQNRTQKSRHNWLNSRI